MSAKELSGMDGGKKPVDKDKDKDKDLLRELGLERLTLEARSHSFWNTQPVPGLLDRGDASDGPIEGPRSVDQIRAAPYSLPGGFAWDTLDLEDGAALEELFALLNENYVEDDDAMFRFSYPPEFLQWVLRPPGWRRAWHVGLRCSRGGRLVGFIAAVPVTIRLGWQSVAMVEINFLCVHKKLRSKRMAPVLIREVTRRVNLEGIFQAVYTAGVLLPRPFSTSRYWHRPLNPKKLIEVGFSRLSGRMTLQRTLRLYRLPAATTTPGFRELRQQDCDAAWALLQRYLDAFDVAPRFSRDDFAHWFLPRPGVVFSYVVERDGELTDFVSFFSLPSSVVRPHPTHKVLDAAYAFYNVSADAKGWNALMTDVLVAARDLGMDVFNALDLMDNKLFLKDLKFGQGNGQLHYYLYNWRSPPLPPHKVALVMQ